MSPEPASTDPIVEEIVRDIERTHQEFGGAVFDLGKLKADAKADQQSKKCLIEQMLPVSVIELIRTAPHNDTVRSVLLAHLKQPVPETCKTFETIKDWIESTFEPPVVSRPAVKKSTMVDIHCQVQEDELGTCTYRVTKCGEGTIPISEARLLEIATESDDDNEFENAVREELMNDWSSYIDTEAERDSDYHYSDREMNDSDNFEFDFTNDGLSALRDRLASLNPEEYERLYE